MTNDTQTTTTEQRSPDRKDDLFSDWLMGIFELNANRTTTLRRSE